MSVCLKERLKACLGTAEDQRMNVMRPLVSVDRFQVLRVAHDVIFDLNTVAAMHVSGLPRDVERLAAIVALDDGNHFGSHFSFVKQTTNA